MRTEVLAPPPGPEPPEPDTRRSRRVTLLVIGLSSVMATLWVAGPHVFAGRDDPTAIDSGRVRKTVQAGCTQLRADLDAVPAVGTSGSVGTAERAEAENRAVEQFVGKVRALGPDALAGDTPVERWLGDWELILGTRRAAVRDGKRFTTPEQGNAPVNVRMYALIRSGLSKCDVPPQLLVPEPGRA